MKRLRREHARLRAALGELGFWGAVTDTGDQAEQEDQVGAENAGRQTGSAAASLEELAGSEGDAKQTNQSALSSRWAACCDAA